MQVILAPGIIAASGTFCKTKDGRRLVVTTRKAPTTNPGPKTRMYLRTAKSYQRTTKVTDKERQIRAMFAAAAVYCKTLSPEQREDYRKQWVKDKQKFNGKKYYTLRGYIFARFCDMYKRKHYGSDVA